MIEVQLKGTGTRRLNLSQLSLDTAGGTRAMRGESVAVIRPGLLDDDNKEEFVSSDFGFPVGLVAESADIPTSSSSNVTLALGLELLSSWPFARHFHIDNLFVIDGHSSL